MDTSLCQPNSGINKYWNMVKDLDEGMKRKLIDLLTASLKKAVGTEHAEDKADADWLSPFAGKWQDERTTEQIISDIYESRTQNKDVRL